MAQSKFTLYKYVKLGDGSWRYKKAAFYSNGKIKPNLVIVGRMASPTPISCACCRGGFPSAPGRSSTPNSTSSARPG